MDIKPGFPGNLSTEQQTAVKDLGAKVASSIEVPHGILLVQKMGGSENFLCRLLRARGWIVEEAHKLCQEILDYRLEHKLDTIVERVVGNQPLQNWEDPNWRPQILNEAAKRVAPMMPCGRHGFTATGQVIEIWRINQLRPNDILEKCSREDISLWWHFHLESGMLSTLEGAAKFQNPLRGQILVFDMHGFGVRHLHKSCISLLISLFGIGQSKYPESLNRVFVLNAPTLFSGLWNTVKGVLNERTRNKIVMTSKGMHDDLKALVPPERMPVFLGGDCPCNIGEEISASGAGFTTVTVAARSELCVPIDVPQGGILSWEFKTDGKDIKFGVVLFALGSYKQGASYDAAPVIIEVAKSGSKGESIAQTLSDCKEGTYLLVFDNRYSMMSSKTVRYALEVGNA